MNTISIENESATCEACIFFKKFSGDQNGYCRRFPPRVLMDRFLFVCFPSTKWPDVDYDDSCGEFKLSKRA